MGVVNTRTWQQGTLTQETIQARLVRYWVLLRRLFDPSRTACVHAAGGATAFLSDNTIENSQALDNSGCMSEEREQLFLFVVRLIPPIAPPQ